MTPYKHQLLTLIGIAHGILILPICILMLYFSENYWNAGSPVQQERYFDNLVISTQSIPCKCEVTSVENTNKERDLMIFPNPTHSFLEFKITDIQLPIMIEIYDLSGMLQIKELVKKKI